MYRFRAYINHHQPIYWNVQMPNTGKMTLVDAIDTAVGQLSQIYGKNQQLTIEFISLTTLTR